MDDLLSRSAALHEATLMASLRAVDWPASGD